MTTPTLSDIARACSVSLATVSKALSPHADRCDLAVETAAHIRTVATTMGWVRADGRRERARKRYHNIGLMWHRHAPSTGWFHETVFGAVASTLDELGQRTVLVPVTDAADWRRVQMALRIDGVIAMADLDDGLVADLERSAYPVVLVNSHTTRAVHQVLADDAGGATLLAAHLHSLGHRHVAYIEHHAPCGHYSEGARATALATAGFRMDTIRGGDLPALIAACRAGATAVVCYNHRQVAGCLAALGAAGLAVPTRISVASCDEVAWLGYLAPSVTAIAVPTPAMATQAARLVVDLIDGRATAACVLTVPEELVPRASTATAWTP